MSNATKCEVCGQFEESLGYSVRIYKRMRGSDVRNEPREYVRRIVEVDHICSDCADAVAKTMNIQDLEELDKGDI